MNLKAVKAKKEILDKFQNLSLIMQIDNNDKRLVEELDYKTFLSILSFKSAQFNSPCYERRLQLKGCKKIPPSENKGDFKFPMFEKNIELKMSFSNKENKINIRQIRIWQDCDYIICFCDFNNINHKCYFLTHEQMMEEVKKRGSATHGTLTANKENKNIEYSITLNIDSDWDLKYTANKELKTFIFS